MRYLENAKEFYRDEQDEQDIDQPESVSMKAEGSEIAGAV
jgi:hypothetical protein